MLQKDVKIPEERGEEEEEVKRGEGGKREQRNDVMGEKSQD